MSAGHTRGPWAAIKAPNGHTYIRDRKGAEIARMGGENILADDSSAAANGELIAQAPALFAALQEIVKNDPYNQSSAGIIARAALAKLAD